MTKLKGLGLETELNLTGEFEMPRHICADCGGAGTDEPGDLCLRCVEVRRLQKALAEVRSTLGLELRKLQELANVQAAKIETLSASNERLRAESAAARKDQGSLARQLNDATAAAYEARRLLSYAEAEVFKLQQRESGEVEATLHARIKGLQAACLAANERADRLSAELMKVALIPPESEVTRALRLRIRDLETQVAGLQNDRDFSET